MISGTWGCEPRYRFLGSKNPLGDGAAVCYIKGEHGKWIVIQPDGEDIPSLVMARRLELKYPGTRRWFREPK